MPTTIAGRAFWKESDPAKRKQQRVHFTKNVSMLGGLLIAAVDTEGKPSLAWRARRAPEAVKHAAADQFGALEHLPLLGFRQWLGDLRRRVA